MSMDEVQGHSRSNYDVFWHMPKIQTFVKLKDKKIVSIWGLSNVDTYTNDTILRGLCENMNALAVKIRQWDSFQRR